jgi:hypothetical protein
MTPAWVVEPFDVVEHVSAQIISGPVMLLLGRSILSAEKKLSIAALSQQLPRRLMLQA